MFRRRQRETVLVPESKSPPSLILDQYVRGIPSAQAAIELFSGEWSSRFPVETGLTAGEVPLFEDPRITWVIDRSGGVDGKHVLELGPLEAGHTYMLHRAGASIVAVESNARAFMKCLIVKEVLDLHRSSFLLGDFVPYLQQTDEKFDLVIASGVLYHSPDPLNLLESIARVGERVAIWTHYFDPAVVGANPNQARMFVPRVEEVTWRDRTFRLHRRDYLESLQWAGFCGGPESSALWMERNDLMEGLRMLGFSRIDVLHDDLSNPNGACVMLFAEK